MMISFELIFDFDIQPLGELNLTLTKWLCVSVHINLTLNDYVYCIYVKHLIGMVNNIYSENLGKYLTFHIQTWTTPCKRSHSLVTDMDYMIFPEDVHASFYDT